MIHSIGLIMIKIKINSQFNQVSMYLWSQLNYKFEVNPKTKFIFEELIRQWSDKTRSNDFLHECLVEQFNK